MNGDGRPNAARTWNVLCGGNAGFDADRRLAGQLETTHPGLRTLARINRNFITATVHWTASRGVAQFLDLGCGYLHSPAGEAVHHTARALNPAAACVYVDEDPFVALFGRAALTEDPGVAVVEADPADAGTVLGDPAVKRLIDFSDPACVVFGGTLSAMPAPAAQNAVKAYAAVLAPASCVIISCLSYADEETAERQARVFTLGTGRPWFNHHGETIEGWFDGAGLRVAGGAVGDVRRWTRPTPVGHRAAAQVLGGVGVLA